MKKHTRRGLLLLVSLCVIFAAGCGKKQEEPATASAVESETPETTTEEKKTEETTTEEATEETTTEETTEESTEAETVALGGRDIPNQIRVIARFADRWTDAGDRYAVTDLDDNGLLEVIALTYSAETKNTRISIYEVNGDGTDLLAVGGDLQEFASQPDLTDAAGMRFYMNDAGQRVFLVQDTIQEDDSHTTVNLISLLLASGSTEMDVYASWTTGPDETGEEQTVYYDASGEEVDEAVFDRVKDDAIYHAQSSGWVTPAWRDVSDVTGLAEDEMMKGLLESFEAMDISNDV